MSAVIEGLSASFYKVNDLFYSWVSHKSLYGFCQIFNGQIYSSGVFIEVLRSSQLFTSCLKQFQFMSPVVSVSFGWGGMGLRLGVKITGLTEFGGRPEPVSKDLARVLFFLCLILPVFRKQNCFHFTGANLTSLGRPRPASLYYMFYYYINDIINKNTSSLHDCNTL